MALRLAALGRASSAAFATDSQALDFRVKLAFSQKPRLLIASQHTAWKTEG